MDLGYAIAQQRQVPVVVEQPGLDAGNVPGEPLTVAERHEHVLPAVQQQDRDRDAGQVFDAAQAAQPFDVKFHTTQGIITVRMLTNAAPCTTFSFRFLASGGYFNKTHCHRLTIQRIFVLQCGDSTGTGSGGPGYAFNDENLAGATYPAGTVAMANAGPNTNGSQFFFTWKDTTLAPNYTPFGTVISGLDVLQKIAAAGDDSQNNPGDGYPNLYTEFRSVQIIPTG